MATTHFSGPIKAGTIREGANVNTGYTLMSQSAVIDITGANATTTVATVPANSQIVSCVLSITTANDDTNAATVTIGTSADADAFLTSTNAKAAAVTFSDVMTSVATDVGTADLDVIATFTATDGDGANGAATATVLYVQGNNLA